MSSIPLPALSVQQPQNPLENVSRIVALKSLLQNQQYQQQAQPLQLQEMQNQTQVSNLQLQERQAMLQSAPNFLQKDDDGKVTGFDTQGYINNLYGKVSPTTVAGLQESLSKATKDMADAGTAQLGLLDKKNDEAYNLLEGVRSSAKQSPEAAEQAYQSAVPKLQGLGVDTSKFPPTFAQAGDQGLQQFEMGLGLHKQIIADAKTQAETAKDAAQAAQANTEATLKGIQVKLAQNSKPGDFDGELNQLASSAPRGALNPGMVKAYQMEINRSLAAGDYEGARSVVKQMTEQVANFQKEQYSQGQENFRQSLNRQAMQSNNLQRNGLEQLDKMFADPQHGYTQFLSQAQATKNTIADAKNGNELAASLAPLMTALGVTSFAGVHRINNTEVNAAGPQVGSLYRRVNAILDKAATGTLPPDTTSEMNGLIDGLIDAKHASVLQGAQMVARNAGLDPSKTAIMDRQGNIATLGGEVQAQQQPKATTPQQKTLPPNIAAQIPEGHVSTLSDGSKWQKVNGVVSPAQ